MITKFNDFSINESVSIDSWKKFSDKLIKDLNLNLYFISTFGVGIGAFYSVVDNLMKNSQLNFNFTKEQVVLLTICAISILVNDNKDAIKKLKEKIEEQKLTQILNNVIESLKSIKNILIKIFLKIGSIATNPGGFLDLFAYTGLLVPSMAILGKLISEQGLSFKDFNEIGGMVLSYGLAVTTLAAKHFLTYLFNKIKKVVDTNESYSNILSFNEYELKYL